MALSTCFSLDQLRSGIAIVERLGCVDSSANRLKSLGIFAGQQVEVSRGGNPLIVKAAGSRIAVSRDIAKHILVRESTE